MYDTMRPKPFRFQIGDNVRISHLKNIFKRETNERWTTEIFVVKARFHRRGIPMYKLNSLNSETLDGTFYEREMQPVTMDSQKAWKIEKIIKTRTLNKRKQHLVRWVGFPPDFDSWLDASQIKSYKPPHQ